MDHSACRCALARLAPGAADRQRLAAEARDYLVDTLGRQRALVNALLVWLRERFAADAALASPQDASGAHQRRWTSSAQPKIFSTA
jgi:hypothetical protein